MAIGDTPNQNLFGTNYNAEEEERKKAEITIQDAIMGAPSSLTPLLSAQQRDYSNLPTTGYDVPEPPRASALSVFTPGGKLKPGIDANAITPSPEMTSTSAVNTALNQEVPVGSPSVEDSFDRSSVRSGRSRAGEGGQNLLRDFLSSFEFQGRRGKKTGDSSVVQTPSTLPPATAQSFFGQAPASNAAEAAQRLISAGPAFTQAQAQAPALDPTSDEAILARRAEREAQFAPRGLMGPEETRARLGGMTLNEYLNAPAGTPGVSGLRTDPQGRMITPTPPLRVEPEVVQPPVDRDIIPAVTQPPVDSVVPTEVAQPPVDALSSFEKDSLARQQRIGGTGSFEGDSEAREARLRENERQPGESQADRDTRVAQSKTTGGQTGGLSFDDARRRAEGQLAARGVKNPSASQVNALARSIQAAEPERLAELETKRALDAIKLRDAEAKKDFKPQIVEIGDQRLIQLAPEYYQPIRPEPKEDEPFEPRILEHNGFIYFERKLNEFERQPATKAGGAAGEVSSAIADAIAAGGGEVTTTPAPTVDTPEVATGDEFTPQIEAGIQRVMADNKITREEAIKALKKERPEVFKLK